MAKANGLMYTAVLRGVNVTSTAQNIWEIITAAASIVIHSIRLEFVPQIASGVAQDLRASIGIQTLSTTGTGGSAVTPTPEHPRNTVAAVTTFNGLVTSPGTLGVVKSASNPSVIVPFERVFNTDQCIPVPGLARLGINLQFALGQPLVLSSEIYFEEF